MVSKGSVMQDDFLNGGAMDKDNVVSTSPKVTQPNVNDMDMVAPSEIRNSKMFGPCMVAEPRRRCATNSNRVGASKSSVMEGSRFVVLSDRGEDEETPIGAVSAIN
ncbi:hypothetical protein V6N12_007480 [Hibiscus sabdariffa]|uniref:Uncharacterized protein n=1 Tax=Hibiscus sabdariffa TaxID=183260 RepID=A0ABR2F1W8_9ROSI